MIVVSETELCKTMWRLDQPSCIRVMVDPELAFANTLSMIASELPIPLTSTTLKFSLSTVTAKRTLPNLCGLGAELATETIDDPEVAEGIGGKAWLGLIIPLLWLPELLPATTWLIPETCFGRGGSIGKPSCRRLYPSAVPELEPIEFLWVNWEYDMEGEEGEEEWMGDEATPVVAVLFADLFRNELPPGCWYPLPIPKPVVIDTFGLPGAGSPAEAGGGGIG
jgi:hypothetical protein